MNGGSGIKVRRVAFISSQLYRRLMVASMTLLFFGAILFVAAMALPNTLPSVLWPLGIMGLIAGLVVLAAVLVDRGLRSLLGLPRRSPSVLPPRSYTCPTCGYTLRGVRGIFCPECGTVRPSPPEEDEEA